MNKKNIINIVCSLLLTLAGGFVDSYTFIYRDGVFATMQTGNLIKFFISLINGEFRLMFLLPIFIFILGCIITALLAKNKYQSHIALVCLLLSFIGAGLCPKEEMWNIICVCLLSFAGAMQFETFRRFLKYRYTSTMATNNMRLFSKSIANKNIEEIIIYASIIITFALGIIFGVLLGKSMDVYSIMPVASIYFVILLIIIINKEDITAIPSEATNE